MRLSGQAFNSALLDFNALQYSKPECSLYESYLTAKWLEINGRYPNPSVSDSNDAVEALFVIEDQNPLGRVYPFRFDWRSVEESGRKTVWNNTTRGPKLATSIFGGGDIRGGLHPDAAQIVRNALSARTLPSREALSALILRNHEFAPGDTWETAEQQLLAVLGLVPGELAAITDPRPLGVDLLDETPWTIDSLDAAVTIPAAVTVQAPPAQAGDQTQDEVVVLDARLERMLKRCIQEYPCVLLAGPPGTGKGTLIRWLVGLVGADPQTYGFRAGLNPNPMWRTPDESWSAFDLVGGLAPNSEGSLIWSNGLLLDSLAEDRWLVLDETNRADLDKIMGPLLTWLSNQEVEVGRTQPHGGVPINLGWAAATESTTGDVDSDTNVTTAFRAGRDWRLLGSYNPQDAMRVFRMGQALSRRFVIIPVPALRPGQFAELLDQQHPELADTVREAVVGLYSAHRSAPETLLGPAIFLRLAHYLGDLGNEDENELLAEAYVANVGKFVSAFDDPTFDSLRTRVVDEEQALPEDQWTWIATQRQTLG